MVTSFTPYSTVAELFQSKPAWIPSELDQARIQSYSAYEQMYFNVPDIYRISLRGTNNSPVFVPTARTIVDTTARYVGADFHVVASGTDSTAAVAAQMAINDLIKRERFRSRFAGAKRYGLIQGDSIWHVTADASKIVGSRIKLTALDPSLYFPVYDPEDVDRIVGCHLAESITNDDGPFVRRLTYRKTPSGGITVEEGLFKLEDWYVSVAPERVIRPVTALPPEITSLPVYHTKNTEEPGNPFGSSELRGLERVMSAVNQTVSDESLALALMGIGMWATDASHPMDPVTKKPIPWQFGPGRVVHHDGNKFDKIAGVGNLSESYGAHYERLWDVLEQASSTPKVAIGNVDVSVATSGIALQLQLGPMLAKSGEKNDLLLDTQNQMWWDLIRMWMPAYEETSFGDETQVECAVGSAIPIDREARFAELNDMLDRGVIDTEYYRLEASKLGYVFPEDMDNRAKAEYDSRQQNEFGQRLASETDTETDQ
jgi:hypothetical protein